MIDDEDNTDETVNEAEPGIKAKSSRAWLALIDAQERAGYSTYQDRCTSIEKIYADLERLSSISREREFQVFWANIQVLQPSMYSRPPVPVVTPRFRDRKPLLLNASELLERTTSVAFGLEDMHYVMRQVRDDLALLNRGCIWVRYETKGEGDSFSERVCIDHKNRRDFVHDPARNWKEVDWVGGGAWMTKKEMRKRFSKTSGNAYQDANFAKRKDDRNNTDGKLKARVWEIWCKSENKVIWVSPGVDVVLDEDEPHLKLEGFFPCPRPAYGTLQRNSLIPVPDFAYYKDQVEEVNELTARISSLAESLEVRGFYPSGAGDLTDAIEAALKSRDKRRVLVPVSNWAMTGSGTKEIIWLPLDMVVSAITQVIALRRQIIDDIYQISGLSDIMRGSTDPKETLGAQTLKTQYGSIRIRDRQDELVRIALDTTRIAAEIMAENFQKKTFLDMSQMDFQSDADVAKAMKGIKAQIAGINAEIQEAQTDPETMQMAKQNPQAAQQILQQAQQQIQQLEQQLAQAEGAVTIEKVIKFLRDQRLRAFSLDIETDSTIQPNEDAEKKRRAEYLTALGGVMNQFAPLVQARPAEAGPLVSEIIKWSMAAFRPGRSMEAVIDEFAEKLAQAGQLADQGKANEEQQAKQAEFKMKQEEAAQKAAIGKAESDAKVQAINAESAAKQTESQMRMQATAAKRGEEAQKHAADMQIAAIELEREKVNLAKAQMLSEVEKAALSTLSGSIPAQQQVIQP